MHCLSLYYPAQSVVYVAQYGTVMHLARTSSCLAWCQTTKRQPAEPIKIPTARLALGMISIITVSTLFATFYRLLDLLGPSATGLMNPRLQYASVSPGALFTLPSYEEACMATLHAAALASAAAQAAVQPEFLKASIESWQRALRGHCSCDSCCC